MKKPVLVVMFYEDGNSEYYMHISYLTSFLIRSPLLIEVPPTNIFPIYVSRFYSRSTYVMVLICYLNVAVYGCRTISLSDADSPFVSSVTMLLASFVSSSRVARYCRSVLFEVTVSLQ